jgi:hypothetical protein
MWIDLAITTADEKRLAIFSRVAMPVGHYDP